MKWFVIFLQSRRCAASSIARVECVVGACGAKKCEGRETTSKIHKSSSTHPSAGEVRQCILNPSHSDATDVDQVCKTNKEEDVAQSLVEIV